MQRQASGSPGTAAFTLVELLTVIAVIGILAAILIPTVGKARQSAVRAKAKVQFSQWATAIETFRTEYGFYPSFPGNRVNGGEPDSTLSAAHFFHDVLAGRRRDGSAPNNPSATDPLGSNNNRKRVTFTTFAVEEIGATGLVTDAFGNTDIAVLIDSDYNGLIPAATIRAETVQAAAGGSATPTSGQVPSDVRAGVLLFSAGAGDGSRNIVFSWQ